MADEKKKNIFDRVIDAVTDRDEKAAAEAARLEAVAKAEAEAKARLVAQTRAAAEARAKDEAEAVARTKAVAEAKAKSEADAKSRAAAEAQGKVVAEAQRRAAEERQALLKTQQEARAAEVAAEQARAALPRHKVAQGDTLSGIALKHYGHAAEPYWRLIYEANKEAIGSSPNIVRAGIELVIPALPAELKK